MKRVALVGLVLVALAIAGALLLDDGRRGPRAPQSPGTPRGVEESSMAPAELEPAASVPAPEPAAAPLAATGDGGRSAARDDRPRIAGHVRVAGGYPAAERARIVAEIFVGRENDGRTLHERVDVAHDGSFELRVPYSARHALLAVDAELLYQPEAVEALPGATDVVLDALYLAELHGRVLPPLGTSLDEVKRVRLKLSPDGIQLPGQTWPLADTPAADGSYRFTCLPVDVELGLAATSPWGPDWSTRIEPLAPGERRELAIALDAGITLAGRVIDEHGAPVDDAWVRAKPAVQATARRSYPVREVAADDRTGADGAFEMTGLPRGAWELEVSRRNSASGPERLVDGTRGDVRDIVLAVERGGCVTGTVEWPDGRPAEQFTLLVEQENVVGDAHRGGRFEQCGIGAETCALQVHAEEDGLEGKGRIEGVRAGQRGIRIVLDARQVFALRGTVRDTDGKLVDRFQIVASNGRRARSISAAGGSFFIDGLDSGEWRVEAKSDDHLAASQEVLVGPSTEPLTFALRTAGRVRGIVLDPAGQPAEAELRITSRKGWRSFEESRSATDGEGRFDVGAVTSPLALVATREGHASSEPVELSVAGGASRDGVVLRLREPCRLEGRVLDAEGRPAAGERVGVHFDEDFHEVETDAHGGFALEGLPPDPCEVIVFRDDGAFVRERITLGAGTTSIELRYQPADPVLVRGTLTRAGRPVACILTFSSSSGFARAESGPDGRFEVTLRRPGAWRVGAVLDLDPDSGEPRDLRAADVVLPDAESHELVLDLDAMRPITSFDELTY
jgi:hypothetical protein